MQEIVIVCSLVEGTIGWRPAFVLFSLIPSHVQASYCLALVFFLLSLSSFFYKYHVLSPCLCFAFVGPERFTYLDWKRIGLLDFCN